MCSHIPRFVPVLRCTATYDILSLYILDLYK